MSKATSSNHISHSYTGIELIGGKDCDDVRVKPDLYVHGGARITKNMIVSGSITAHSDIIIEGNLVGMGQFHFTNLDIENLKVNGHFTRQPDYLISSSRITASDNAVVVALPNIEIDATDAIQYDAIEKHFIMKKSGLLHIIYYLSSNSKTYIENKITGVVTAVSNIGQGSGYMRVNTKDILCLKSLLALQPEEAQIQMVFV